MTIAFSYSHSLVHALLQKLIKDIPSLAPSEEANTASAPTVGNTPCQEPSKDSSNSNENSPKSQQHGDNTTEEESKPKQTVTDADSSTSAENGTKKRLRSNSFSGQSQPAGSMTRNPGEVAFFKLLHAEFKKTSHFFDRATEEFTIREERVREGMSIMKQPNSIMVSEKWALMAKSIYRLYKDLLLLETFAIMSFCSFSKILKKHDKVSGYQTRTAFMSNIVSKANFTHYPQVMEMIRRCEQLYEEVSENLLREGKEGLYEDERLFINMIHRLNEQVLNSDNADIDADRTKRSNAMSTLAAVQKEFREASKLRSLVEENDNAKTTLPPSEGRQEGDGDDDDSDDSGKVTVPTKPSKRVGTDFTEPESKRVRTA